MIFFLLLIMLISAIPLILLFLVRMLQIKPMNKYNKNLPFECGFSSLGTSRNPFSSRFFLLSVIFLVFDVELVLLFPLVYKLQPGFLHVIFFISIIFLILMLGTLYEWKEGTFDWVS